MSQDDVTMTKAQFQTILRLARAEAWDECAEEAWSVDYLNSPKYEDMEARNPYRIEANR